MGTVLGAATCPRRVRRRPSLPDDHVGPNSMATHWLRIPFARPLCQRHVKLTPLSAGAFHHSSQHLCYRRGLRMGRRGRKRRLGVEDEYWGLTLGGVGTGEACRLIGIGRKTGCRWRAERGGLPPLRLSEAVRGRRYLSRSSASASHRYGLETRACGDRQATRAVTCRRSVGSCAATSAPMTAGCTTATWPRPAPGSELDGAGPAGCPPTPSSRLLSKRSSSSNGALGRSAPGCAPPFPTAPGGTCATRRSTRRSIPGREVA
jgi:hypothetical protein